MRYVCETVGTTTVVTLLDDALDAQNSKEFRRSVEAEVRDKESVLFDLQHVRFMDSSGLGAVLSCLRLIEGGGGGLRLCELGPEVRKAIELVRMDRLLDVYRNRAEALAAARDGAPTLET
ncbi:MAG TPA: STAS domain-containing protein [Planctomycetota bacterium]|nr:STAS domain-containing protein [Planctomycetota bacterium]